MCRWFAYLGNERILLKDVLIDPDNAITKQLQTRYLPNGHIETAPTTDGLSLYNLDGFGVSWYSTLSSQYDTDWQTEMNKDCQKERRACVYRTTRPPLNELNLLSMASNAESKCIFAHIRAGTAPTATVDVNNHPFAWGNFLFMHNGSVAEFPTIKIDMLNLLSDAARRHIRGTTDTEHCAALFFTYLDPDGPWTDRKYSLDQLKLAMKKTIAKLIELFQKVADPQKTYQTRLNFAVTGGYRMLCTRYSFPVDMDPPSLYWSDTAGALLNSKFDGNPNHRTTHTNPCKHKASEYGKHFIVASEPMTYDDKQWHLIPKNTMVWADKDMEHGSESL